MVVKSRDQKRRLIVQFYNYFNDIMCFSGALSAFGRQGARNSKTICLWLKNTRLLKANQMLPTVFNLARGWISACDNTVVWARNRSTRERTKGRIAAEVTSTGASPSRAARSKASRTPVMNSDSFEGCMAS